MKKLKNKFKNLTKKDWKEANEISKKHRGLSSLTFEEVYGRSTK